MNRPSYLVLTAAAGALPLGLLAVNLGSVAPHGAAQTAPAASPAPRLLASPNAAAVADAANAFLATLSEKQRAVAQIELTPRLAGRWSNFPVGVVPRNGVFFRDLNETQVAAAMKVARLALSEEGFTRFQEVRAADDAFARSHAGRGPVAEAPAGAVPEAQAALGQVPAGRLRAAACSSSPTRTGTAS